MIAFFKTFLSIIMSIVSLFSSLFGGGLSNAAYTPVDEENCNLNFAVISDVHMTSSVFRKFMLELGLYDMENAQTRLDALILAGDITDHGNQPHYEALEDVFSKYDPAEAVYLAVGNHDTWNNEIDEDDRFPRSKELFLEYYEKICGREIDNVYYSAEIEGYTFIFLSSEGDSTSGYISDEQIQWLSDELEKASEKDLPIFIISHWPLAGTHGLPITWLDHPFIDDDSDLDEDSGSFSDGKSAEIRELLEQYENIFYISGHLHNGLANNVSNSVYSYSSIESEGSLHFISLPSYMFGTTKGTNMSNGNGFQIEVYDDEVVIRARSFSSGVWLTNYDVTFALT